MKVSKYASIFAGWAKPAVSKNKNTLNFKSFLKKKKKLHTKKPKQQNQTKRREIIKTKMKT